jgi:hypothetical protein
VLKHILIRGAEAVAVLALSALIGTTGLLVWLFLDHSRETMLPAPTGTYTVGRVTYDWTDAARLNRYAPVAAPNRNSWSGFGTPQQYAVRPACRVSSEVLEKRLEHHQGFVLRRLFRRDLSRVRSYSWSEVAVSPQKPPYPVVILRAGGGALSSDYTSIASDHPYTATVVVVDHHALLHPAGGQETRHQETCNVAHLPAHLYGPSLCHGGRREGGAGVVATQLVTHHDEHLRASADARETGSTAESGGNGAVGETRTGGQNDGLTAPRVKQGISAKSFILLASPTGFEPVLSP